MRDCPDGAVVLELQEQTVAPRRRELGAEADAPRRARLLGMDVQEGQIPLAQRDQVAVGPQVRLDAGQRPSATAEVVGQIGRRAGGDALGRQMCPKRPNAAMTSSLTSSTS